MLPVHTISTRRSTPTQRGLPRDVDRNVRPHDWYGIQAEPRGSGRMLSGLPEIEGIVAQPRDPTNDSAERVLSATEFDTFLTRERNLADRGTRLFSLMVLRRSGEASDGWWGLAQALRERLRSTDLVAQLEQDRVALLLTDTGPEGACVVAGWIELLVAELGITIDPKIYVYPSPDATTSAAGTPLDCGQRTGDGKNGRPRGPSNNSTRGHPRVRANGQSNGRPSGQSNGHAEARSSEGKNGHVTERVDGAKNGHATTSNGQARPTDAAEDVSPAAELSRANWPVADLWAELSVPTPLWKRSLDILVSGLALLLLLPVFVVVAIAIRLESPGPVIFRQMRAGRAARPFAFYKFRSMFVDAEKRRAELEALNEKDGPIFKIHDDPRVTCVGRILRRWSIDELPQLWNIFKGDISLVGPRSPTLDEVAAYERWQRRRLNVTGGITCIWQVSGRSEISFKEWMRMDMRYVKRCSLWLDLSLLARTLPAVLSGRGAY